MRSSSTASGTSRARAARVRGGRRHRGLGRLRLAGDPRPQLPRGARRDRPREPGLDPGSGRRLGDRRHDALGALARALPARLAAAPRADVLGLAGRPARQQRPAGARRRARARALALPRVGPAPHGRAGHGRRGARLRPRRDRRAAAGGRLAAAGRRRDAPLHAARRRSSWPSRRSSSSCSRSRPRAASPATS